MEELIREEAYLIWECRMRHKIPGTQAGDWIQAERKIRRKELEDCFAPDMANRIEKYL